MEFNFRRESAETGANVKMRNIENRETEKQVRHRRQRRPVNPGRQEFLYFINHQRQIAVLFKRVAIARIFHARENTYENSAQNGCATRLTE